jgi:hypothetical protein
MSEPSYIFDYARAVLNPGLAHATEDQIDALACAVDTMFRNYISDEAMSFCDVQEAAVELAAYIFRMQKQGFITSQTEGLVSTSWSLWHTWPATITMLIMPYFIKKAPEVVKVRTPPVGRRHNLMFPFPSDEDGVDVNHFGW